MNVKVERSKKLREEAMPEKKCKKCTGLKKDTSPADLSVLAGTSIMATLIWPP